MYTGITIKGDEVVFQAVNEGVDYPEVVIKDQAHLFQLLKPFADMLGIRPSAMTLFKEPGKTYPKWVNF